MQKQPEARDRATPRPDRIDYPVLRQIVQLIPEGLANEIAREHGADIRKFTCRDHLIALLAGQLTRASSLNEICDSASLHESELRRMGMTCIPKRNTFSHANRTRDPAIAEQIYLQVYAYLKSISPGFMEGRKHRRRLHRLKRNIFAIDSTTIQLALSCIDWAKHRSRKAAAKTHLALNIGSMLPSVIHVEDAGHHDSTRAELLCANMQDGDVLLADRAYVKFPFLADLDSRGIFFVLRQKTNMVFEVVEERTSSDSSILADQTIRLTGDKGAAGYTKLLRRVVAVVEVDGKEKELVFITNNFDWSPRTIADLYKARWSIEIFFKELKQTAELSDFVGTNEKAVKWQIWVALLAHLLLRFLKFQSKWQLSFSRMVGTIRSSIWMKISLIQMLRIYGTAGGPKPPVIVDKQLLLKGFEQVFSAAMG